MLILGNGRVVTRNPECPYMEEGAVAIDGKVICKVGPTDELKKAIQMQSLLMQKAE